MIHDHLQAMFKEMETKRAARDAEEEEKAVNRSPAMTTRKMQEVMGKLQDSSRRSSSQQSPRSALVEDEKYAAAESKTDNGKVLYATHVSVIDQRRDRYRVWCLSTHRKSLGTWRRSSKRLTI